MPTLAVTIVALLIAAQGDSLTPPAPAAASFCWVAALAGPATIALPGLLAGPWARRARNGFFARRRLAWVERLALGLALGLFAALELGLGWPLQVKEVVPLQVPALAHAVGLLPFLAACLAGAGTVAWSAQRLGLAPEPPRTVMGLTLRTLLVPAVPYVVFLGLTDLGVFFPNLTERLVLDPAATALGFLALLPVLFLLAPLALGYLFPGSPLPAGPLRENLAALARRARVGCAQIVVWRTGARSLINACIAGVFPWTRRVFLTDALIGLLNEADLEVVFAHELGHARRHHFLLFVALGVALLLLLLTVPVAPAASSWWQDTSLAGLALAAFLVFFALLSRQLEYEADAFSAELLQDPLRVATTLDHLARLLPGGGRRGGWRHPPLPRRVRRLNALATRPRSAWRTRATGWVLRAATLTVLIVAAVLHGREVARLRARPAAERALETVRYLLHEHDASAYRPGFDAARARASLERARALLAEAEAQATLDNLAEVSDLAREVHRRLAPLPPQGGPPAAGPR